MTKINDGGPAFANMAANSFGPVNPRREGMSLRAYFAGQALPSVIAICAGDNPRIGESLEGMFARKAIACADTLIAELEKDATS